MEHPLRNYHSKERYNPHLTVGTPLSVTKLVVTAQAAVCSLKLPPRDLALWQFISCSILLVSCLQAKSLC